MTPEQEKAMEKLNEISEIYTAVMEDEEKRQEEYWNSLTKDQQLDVFCCVSRRILKGEIEDCGSYRYVLYDVFGFGMESYTLALDAGYMTIHNAIYDSQRLDEHCANSEIDTLIDFCKKNNIENGEEKVLEYTKNK